MISFGIFDMEFQFACLSAGVSGKRVPSAGAAEPGAAGREREHGGVSVLWKKHIGLALRKCRSTQKARKKLKQRKKRLKKRSLLSLMQNNYRKKLI